MTLEIQIQKPVRTRMTKGLTLAREVIRHPLAAFIFAMLLFVLTITYLGSGIKLWANTVEFKPGVVEAMGVNPNFDTFQGTLLQEKAFQTPDVLPLYGSSEMSMINAYHPAKVFTPETGMTPFLFGKGGTQTIIQALSLGSLEDLQGKKVAIFITPQWYGPNGIQQSTFEGNFAPLHAYEILFQSDLSPKLKKQVAKRIINYPGAYKDFPYLKKMLTSEANSGFQSKADQILNWLPARMEYAGLEYQDLIKMRWQIKNLSQEDVNHYSKKAANPQSIDWVKLKKEAILKGKNSTTNNSFGMDNTFYQDYLVSRLKEKKDADRNDKLSVSPEYDDLKMMMQILKEKGAKPLFVIIPMHGPWYDYTGLKRSERELCYQNLRTLVQDEGYPVADFSPHEYEEYYLKDPWHFAWKGWVDVDQRLYEFYRQ